MYIVVMMTVRVVLQCVRVMKNEIFHRLVSFCLSGPPPRTLPFRHSDVAASAFVCLLHKSLCISYHLYDERRTNRRCSVLARVKPRRKWHSYTSLNGESGDMNLMNRTTSFTDSSPKPYLSMSSKIQVSFTLKSSGNSSRGVIDHS